MSAAYPIHTQVPQVFFFFPIDTHIRTTQITSCPRAYRYSQTQAKIQLKYCIKQIELQAPRLILGCKTCGGLVREIIRNHFITKCFVIWHPRA